MLMAILNNLLATLGKIFKKKKSARKKRNKEKTRGTPSRRAKAGQGGRKSKISRKSKRTLKKKSSSRKRTPVKTSRSSASGRKKTKKKKIPKKRKTVKSTPEPKKRAVKKKRIIHPKKKPVREDGILIGEVTHYFSKIMVCVVKMTRGSMRVGDQIRIKGSTSDFAQKAKSLQIESRDVHMAKKGQLVGLKVDQLVRSGDKVYNSTT